MNKEKWFKFVLKTKDINATGNESEWWMRGSSVMKKVALLDHYLTNKDFDFIISQMHNKDELKMTAVKWLETEREIYLGDSGYSRIIMSIDKNDHVHLFFTDNSRQQVKDKWNDPEAVDLRSAIEKELTQALAGELAGIVPV